MEQLFSTICDHAESAPLILFFLLLVAGLNIPISEDIILITGGAMVSLCAPEIHWRMYFLLFLGCWLSAWECYALGRFFGPKIYNVPWFNHWINPKSVARVHRRIEKYKYLTFFGVRFIPGGIRNTFFMTCGLGKMPFKTFIFRDGMAALLASFVIFHLGYEFASHYHEIIATIERYQKYFIYLTAIVLAVVLIGVTFARREK